MDQRKAAYCLVIVLIAGLFAVTGVVSGAAALNAPGTATPLATWSPEDIASPEELAKAQAEWQQSAHADTYDGGMGANTTCARCKSPVDWDPGSTAVEASLDCASCKRIPGQPRPSLTGEVSIAQEDWHNIGCTTCHPPAGDSVVKKIAFLNQPSQSYLPVDSSTELCAHCHEGRHGFEVVSEQNASPAHQGWECTRCHGAHGIPVKCTDCHNPMEGRGAQEHANHPKVNCTACHDNGGLDIWQDPYPNSRHYQEYITRRFAHALTSWPSHNIKTQVDCRKCHHPLKTAENPLVTQVGCTACHPDGAVSLWCTYFKRDPDPFPTAISK